MKRIVSALLALAAGAALQAAEVSVAVAANFAGPMREIAQAFERDTGHKAVIALGSTGKLYAQIKQGAPFEVLLSADAQTPARLEAEGLGVAGSRWTYATGHLVLWSPQSGLVDAQAAVLRSGQFKRLAMADPKLAPYGAAALQTLQHLGLLKTLEGKLVQGDSIAQTYQFVATGNAELGFLALSQLVLDARLRAGSVWQVPAHMHAPLLQDALLLVKGRQQPAALALLAYLRSESARSIISRHGYTV